MISIVVQCTVIAFLIISIVKPCIRIKSLMISIVVHALDLNTYDKHSCAMHLN